MALKNLNLIEKIQIVENMNNKTHKCIYRNNQINLSAQEFE